MKYIASAWYSIQNSTPIKSTKSIKMLLTSELPYYGLNHYKLSTFAFDIGIYYDHILHVIYDNH